MKVKQAFLYKPFDLRVEEVELRKITRDEVLVKVHTCGICGSDVECLEGKTSEGRYDIQPYVPGHEFAGEVIEVGGDVRNIKVGDKVTSECVVACGVCQNCKDGLMPSACLNFKEIGFGPDTPGGMGEYLICGEVNLHKIPDDWSYVEGAWVEPFSIGYFSIWGNGGYIDASDTALIFGCGPIGLSALIVAKTSGAAVIMADPIESRREIAKKFGADHALDPSLPSFAEDVARISGGGPTVISECSGNDKAVASVFQIAGHNCRVSFTGHTAGRDIPVEIGKINWRTLRIKGSGGTDHFTPRTIRFMSRIRDKYNFEDMTTHYFKFSEIDKAFDIAVNHKKEAIKVMLLFQE
jgi:threonine dehydrogenase-like Zn-dependent dehydrogenase